MKIVEYWKLKNLATFNFEILKNAIAYGKIRLKIIVLQTQKKKYIY